MRLPGNGVRERLTRSAGDGGRAAGAGEGEPPLGRVEVRAVGEGEQGLVAESCRGGAIEQVGHVASFAGVLELDPRLVGYAGGHVEGLINIGRQLGEDRRA